MAIENIKIYYLEDDNKIELDSELYTSFPAHTPNSIYVDVTYTISLPEKCTMIVRTGELTNNGYDPLEYELLGGYDCIPYSSFVNDNGINVITYLFSTDFLKTFMDDFSDTLTEYDRVLDYLPNMTKNLFLQVVTEDVTYPTEYKKIILQHSAAQIGEVLQSGFQDNNISAGDITYYGAENEVVYIYFYLAQVGEIQAGVPVTYPEYYVLDYDDEILYDYDGNFFTINDIE